MRILATMAVMILLTLPISMSGRTGVWTSESQCDTTGLSDGRNFLSLVPAHTTLLLMTPPASKSFR